MNVRTAQGQTQNDGIDRLREMFGVQLSSAAAVLEHHSHDESHHEPASPDAVLFAESTEDVVKCVQVCRDYQVPLVPFGVGTSLEGHVQALRGGVSLDLSRMSRILRVSAEDMDCTVEAGVTRRQLADHLKPHGLFFPVDPGADATLGGMAATGASGTTTVRYGAMREVVLSLKVVLPNGEVIETARRARKTSAGYDLTRLFIGSEGTLGVVTELSLRLFGIPESTLAAIVQFDDLHAAISAVSQIIQLGVGVARIELLDKVAVAAVNKYSGLSLAPRHLLLFEFHGSPRSVAGDADVTLGVVTEFGGSNWESTPDQRERTRLWRARHDAAWAVRASCPGGQLFITDVCVPISHLANMIEETHLDLSDHELFGPIIGHVGDGNFHVVCVVPPNDPAELSKIEAFNERLITRALGVGGTCTGEHGIGLGKISHLHRELGKSAVDVMRAIKSAIDPQNIMNPGKVTTNDR